MGGNLSPGLLVSAYSQGIFPWFNDEDPILWWSPDPRFVLDPLELHVSASMRKVLRKGRFELSVDRDFRAIIENCSRAPRPGQRGTWITGDMVDAYVELHRLGYAHSAEAWLDGELAGGCYGVSLGRVFFGESMFSKADNASKAAFIPLVWRLLDEGIALVDSQVRTAHVESLGGRDIPRADYLAKLASLLTGPSPPGSWGGRFPDYPSSSSWERIVTRRQGR
ncbi:MAG: leucyl/phenylalanyl-tRNA--protein transferase [Spirochaetes bacterium]|nr:leucyl/phenylalanyl-tRNA--protein transferase [Spirochaetota bacterium]